MDRRSRLRRPLGSAVLLAAAAMRRGAGRQAVVLGLLLGVAGGIVVAALSGAQRIESSYDVLLDEIDAPDFLAFDFDGNFTPLLAADPAVRALANVTIVYPVLRTADGTLLGPLADECETGTGELSAIAIANAGVRVPSRVIAGRLPADGAADEVAIPTTTMHRAGLHVGDTVYMHGTCHNDESPFDPPLPLRVVGEVVGFLDVRTTTQDIYQENVIVAPALLTAADRVTEDILGVWLHDGRMFDDLQPELRDGAEEWIALAVGDHAATVSAGLRPDATALRILALGMGVAAAAIFSQLIARHLRMAATDHSQLLSLGMRRSELWTVSMLHAALIAAGAMIAAVVVASVLAPRMPTGAAEPLLRGISAAPRPVILALAAVAVAIVVAVIAMVPAWLTTRTLRDSGISAGRPTLASRVVGIGLLGTVESWGVRVALEPRSGTQPVPVRSGLGATAVAGAMLVGVVTFGAGLDHLRATPRLGGWNWDVIVFADDPAVLADAVRDDPAVERMSVGTIFPHGFSVGGGIQGELFEIALGTGPNAIVPITVAGRAPEGDDEILLSAAMSDRLKVQLGDLVQVQVPDPFYELLGTGGEPRNVVYELVGIGVVPVGDGRLDQGASFTLGGIQRALSYDEARTTLSSVEPDVLAAALARNDLRDLAAEVATTEDLAATVAGWSDEELSGPLPSFGPEAVFIDATNPRAARELIGELIPTGLLGPESFMIGVSEDGSEVRLVDVVRLDLDDVGWVPAALGATMGLAALAVLAHLVSTGARARRRDFAVLRSMGLTPRQVRQVIRWQAATMAVVTGIIAALVGVIGGRIAWTRYAEGLGVVPEPVTPWLLIAVVSIGLLAACLAVSVYPGVAASRDRPADLLRDE